MNLPFTIEQFVDVFRRYNEAVWPMPWFLTGIAIVALIAVLRSSARPSRVAAGCLAALWLWMGVVYHIVFFRAINSAAVVFGAAFIGQGLGLAWWALRGRGPRLEMRGDWSGVVAFAMIFYALALYPIVGAELGHRYPGAPTFGVPCPTTIFTLGLLLLAPSPRPPLIFVVPVAWSVLGAVATVRLGMTEDAGLVAAGAAAVVVLIAERAHREKPARRRSLAAHT